MGDDVHTEPSGFPPRGQTGFGGSPKTGSALFSAGSTQQRPAEPNPKIHRMCENSI